MLTTEQFHWLLQHADPPRRVGPSNIMIMGDGPLPWTAWRDRLFALRRNVYFPDQLHATLLVGRTGWEPSIIRHLIEMRQGLAVRIVSQEMMLAWLLTGVDPFVDPPQARVLWGDHPVYRFLDGDGGFQWPSLIVPSPDDDSDDDPEGPVGGWGAGLLSAAGYRVGIDASDARTRRRALENAYAGDDALVEIPATRRRSLGAAQSARRLQAIARAIARQHRLASNRHDDMQRALRHWEADLAWLRTQYYDDNTALHHRFDWPLLGAATPGADSDAEDGA